MVTHRFSKAKSVDQIIDDALKPPSSTLVNEAGDVTTTEPPGEPELTADMDMPWANAEPRILSFFQIRMPEPLKLKIQWLHARQLGTKKESQHAIALAALEREVDRLVAKAHKASKKER